MKFSYLIILASLLCITACAKTKAPQNNLAKPTAAQIRFADWEVGAFIHYGLNPYTDMEHGDGQFSPEYFDPSELDAEQWVLAAKAIGARYVCLTVRHEGGFCLWPSKTTDYTIANSPYKNGKGDIAREFVDACRKHDIVPAFYHTAMFDANAAIGKYEGDLELPLKWMSTWGQAVQQGLNRPGQREKFKQIQVEQMRELLTNYGPIGFMWSDHWDATDPDGVWRAVQDVARELQPDMVFMGPDTWVPGNETGHVVYPMWNAVHTVDGTINSRPAAGSSDLNTENSYGLLEGEVRTGHPLGEFWRVRECTTAQGFHYGGWFWHPDSVKVTKPKKHWEHIDLYYRTVGLGANTIINLPPNTKGLIDDDFVVAAKALGDAINERFSNPIAELKHPDYGNVLELKWIKPQRINTVVTMENIANGQKVVNYTLEAYVDGKWQVLEPLNKLVGFAPYNNNPGFETIGHKKIDRVAPVVTNRVRFRCLESVVDEAELRYFAVYDNEDIIRTYGAGYPYLSGVETINESAHGGVRRDVDYRGNILELNGESYDYGLMLCPVGASKKGYALYDMSKYSKAKGMTATIGVEDMKIGNGSVEFIVQVLIGGKWTELYKSPILKGGDEGMAIKVDFPKGVEELKLVCTDGGDNSNSDHSVWFDAKFFE